jgi:hypothetical protein
VVEAAVGAQAWEWGEVEASCVLSGSGWEEKVEVAMAMRFQAWMWLQFNLRFHILCISWTR